MRQVILNLAGNAVKIHSQAKIKRPCPLLARRVATRDLQFMCHEYRRRHPAEEHRLAIFAPFVQRGHVTTRQFGGTGLGLTIAP